MDIPIDKIKIGNIFIRHVKIFNPIHHPPTIEPIGIVIIPIMIPFAKAGWLSVFMIPKPTGIEYTNVALA